MIYANVGQIMRLAPVIPVLVIDDPSQARPIAEALVRGGLRALEVTLRTPAALKVIQEIARVDGAVVGAGTVVNKLLLDRAIEAGSKFIVTPGLTRNLGLEVVETGMPFLPGVANAADILTGLELGLSHFKFFPAVYAGGLPLLKALLGPFVDIRICPTGGITLLNAQEWLDLEQVLCVGGTWLQPRGKADLSALETAARQAAALRAS